MVGVRYDMHLMMVKRTNPCTVAVAAKSAESFVENDDDTWDVEVNTLDLNKKMANVCVLLLMNSHSHLSCSHSRSRSHSQH